MTIKRPIINIIVQAGLPEVKEPAKPEKSPLCRLQEKVDYAIDCLEADWRKEEAVDFLRKAKNKLESLERPKKEHTALLEVISLALSDYGHYHLDGEIPE